VHAQAQGGLAHRRSGSRKLRLGHASFYSRHRRGADRGLEAATTAHGVFSEYNLRVGGSAFEMLQALRKVRFTELALALASVLTVLGSLGLHPEPAVAGPANEIPAWDGSGRAASGPHDCPICLAHRSVPLNHPSAVVLEPISSVPAHLCLTIWLLDRLAPSPHGERAPPSA